MISKPKELREAVRDLKTGWINEPHPAVYDAANIIYHCAGIIERQNRWAWLNLCMWSIMLAFNTYDFFR